MKIKRKMEIINLQTSLSDFDNKICQPIQKILEEKIQTRQQKRISYQYQTKFFIEKHRETAIITYQSLEEKIDFIIKIYLQKPDNCEITICLKSCPICLSFYPETGKMLLHGTQKHQESLNLPALDTLFEIGEFLCDRLKNYFNKAYSQ